jgi:hypothetical protein
MCTLFNILQDPIVGIPLSVRAPFGPIKERARTLKQKFSRKQKFSQHTVDVGFYAPAA